MKTQILFVCLAFVCQIGKADVQTKITVEKSEEVKLVFAKWSGEYRIFMGSLPDEGWEHTRVTGLWNETDGGSLTAVYEYQDTNQVTRLTVTTTATIAPDFSVPLFHYEDSDGGMVDSTNNDPVEIVWEQGSLSAAGALNSAQINSDIKVMLKSGGLADADESGDQSLVILGGAATEKTMTRSGDIVVSRTNVPPTEITVAGQRLGSNSSAYKSGPKRTPVELKQEQPVPYALVTPFGASYVPITECWSDIPTNKARRTIGVGEEVKLKFKPAYPYAAHPIAWGAINGTVQIGTDPLFTASDVAGPAKAIANIPYNNPTVHFPIVFTVKAPSGIDHTDFVSYWTYPDTTHAGAGMHLRPYVAPTDVSFYRVQVLEVGKDASSVTGYFATNNNAPSHIGHGANAWIDLNQDNSWREPWDNATSTGWAPPWSGTGFSGGSYTWEIPGQWRVINGSAHSDGFTGWNQVHTLSANGSMTVTKFGHSVTRTIQNIYSGQ